MANQRKMRLWLTRSVIGVKIMILRNGFLIFIILVTTLFGCDNKVSKQFSVCARAVLKSDGSDETRETTRKEMKEIDQLQKMKEEIDRTNPGPEIPFDAKLHKVISIDSDSNITIEGGQVIQLEGIKCFPGTSNYFRKLILGDSERIAFIPVLNQKGNNLISAYVWHASLSLMNDPELKDIVNSPTYSPLNEVALTSRWCIPRETPHNKYFKRYVALSKLARRCE